MPSDFPQLLSLVCPNCGGSLELTSRADLFKCRHCQNLPLLRWPSPQQPETARLIEKEKWAANLLRPGSSANWQGGELVLTDRELAFVPHGLNLGPLERAVLPLASIASHALETGLISDEITFIDQSGSRWGLRVRNGKSVLEAIGRG